jgi:hypothetical protein
MSWHEMNAKGIKKWTVFELNQSEFGMEWFGMNLLQTILLTSREL